MPKLIDTHSHVNFNSFKDDWNQTLSNTLDSDIWVINVGSQASTSKRAVEIANKYNEGIYASVGLHPTHLFETHVDIEEASANFTSRKEDFDINFYKKLAQDKKVVAIGEMGLDYHFLPENINKEEGVAKQKLVFRQGLDLADELNLPIIIHSRDTHDDIQTILKEYKDANKLKRCGVIHCYTGTWEEAKKYLELGFLISFTGIITFEPKGKNKEKQEALLEVVKNTPLDKIMIETDAPYLAPAPYRGKKNEPLYVRYVAEFIAKIKNINFEEVANTTTKTAKSFFNI